MPSRDRIYKAVGRIACPKCKTVGTVTWAAAPPSWGGQAHRIIQTLPPTFVAKDAATPKGLMIECAACHVPALVTGPSTNPLFNRQNVPLFSDLLLHDIGTGDGIAQASAAPEEIRTPALWGLRLRRPLMHDGSAATVESAIGQHRNEADLARRGFDQLSAEDRKRLVAFLHSL